LANNQEERFNKTFFLSLFFAYFLVQNSLLPGVEVYGGFWKDIGGLSGVSVQVI
jgi:hypothetical protein